MAGVQRLIEMMDGFKIYEKCWGEDSQGLGDFIYSVFISPLYVAFYDWKLDSAGSPVCGFQEHRTLGRAGRRREWEQAPAWCFPSLECRAFLCWAGSQQWPGLRPRSGLGQGGAGLGWYRPLGSNGVLCRDFALWLGGGFTSCRVEECYRLVNYILKNILSTPLK